MGNKSSLLLQQEEIDVLQAETGCKLLQIYNLLYVYVTNINFCIELKNYYFNW